MTVFGKWYKDLCRDFQTKENFQTFEVEFDEQVNDYGRIQSILRFHPLEKNIDKCFSKKCNKKSEHHRNIGNKYYSRKEFEKALQSYSHSISFGLDGSKELALAYANRSVVLYATDNHQLCQNDIQLAFNKGYPTNLHYKLNERLGRCYLKNGNTKLASETFKHGLVSLGNSDLNVDKKNELAHTFSDLISNCSNFTNSVNFLPLVNQLYMVSPPVIPTDDANDKYPCACKSFSIIETKNEGRHAVATRDIPIGEVIIVEKPFTSVCLSNRLETHCYSCLKRFMVSYPCRNCASVNYCSSDCENKCWESFHHYECEYLDLLFHDDIGLGHLALKMIIQVGIKGLKDIRNEANSLGINTNGIYDPMDYECVYSLVGNSHLRKSSDLFRRSLIALYLCHIMFKTGFINECDDFCIVGSHLLKQLQMLPCNAHEVSELQLEGDDVANSELREIGSAAYTTLSLLNHSCDPSVVRHCYGDVCVLRAVKYIRKGEQIIDNYGHLYPVELKVDRQKDLLDQYYFSCECIPCREDWPLYNDIIQEDPKFYCNNCGNLLVSCSTCPKCNHIDTELDSYQNLHADYQICMENILSTGEYSQDLPKLLDYSNILSRKAKLPVIHFNNCQEVIKLCFGLQGNFVKLKC